jgi:purine-binding chemotaxis protein CheW
MAETTASPLVCVSFEVGDVTYAFDIQRVREVLRPLPLKPLPNAQHAVIGVVDHRGEVVPVLDLRVRFGVAGSPERARFIMAQRGGKLVGIVVDRVTEVFDTRDAEARELSEVSRSAAAGQEIVSAYAREGSLTFVLDVDRLTDWAASEPRALTQNGRLA